MFSQKSVLRIIVLASVSIVLAACGGSESTEPGEVLISCDVPMVSDAAGTSCVAPEPIECPVPTVPDVLNESCVVGIDPAAPKPTIFAGENQALLFYNRVDGE
ncbi:MAG: pullulanase, partial [Flavobacteriales bacterium]